MSACPTCAARLPAGETICAECGTDVVVTPSAARSVSAATEAGHTAPSARSAPASAAADGVICPDCGEQVRPDRNGWCPACGYPFDGIEAPLAGAFPSASSRDLDLRAFRGDAAPRPRTMEPPARVGGPETPAALPPGTGADGGPGAGPAPGAVVRSGTALGDSPPTGSGPEDPARPPEPALRSVAAGAAPGAASAPDPRPSPVATLTVAAGGHVLYSGRMTRVVPLDVDELLIGRSDPGQGLFPDIDLTHLRESDGHLSRRHARLVRSPDGWTVEDLAVNDSTWLNDHAHPLDGERVLLQDGDRILLGHSVAFVYREAGHPR